MGKVTKQSCSDAAKIVQNRYKFCPIICKICYLIRFRTFKANGAEQKVHLRDVSGIGDIYFWREMNEAGKRQQKWMDSFFESQNYFKAYTKDSHETAINDIRNILNNQMFWDLEEIWLIDPYLTPNDILETVLFCSKPILPTKNMTIFFKIDHI